MIIQALGLFALFLAAPARADVSDSGNLTIGGQGVIQGTMTVQGSGFSVGGTTFSVAGGSVTLGGRLNAAAAGIKWADGTTSTSASAASAFSGLASSGTIVPVAYPVTTTSNYVCLATVTFTTSNGRMLFVFDGVAFNGVSAGYMKFRVLIDGADPTELGTGTYMATLRLTNSGSDEAMNFSYAMRQPISAGTHDFAFCPRSTVGNTHLDGDGGNAPQLFTVVDLGK